MLSCALLAIFCFDSWEKFHLLLFVLRPALGIVQSSSNSHDDKHSPLTGESGGNTPARMARLQEFSFQASDMILSSPLPQGMWLLAEMHSEISLCPP